VCVSDELPERLCANQDLAWTPAVRPPSAREGGTRGATDARGEGKSGSDGKGSLGRWGERRCDESGRLTSRVQTGGWANSVWNSAHPPRRRHRATSQRTDGIRVRAWTTGPERW